MVAMPPSPTYYGNHPYVFWENGFSDEQLAAIIEMGNDAAQEPAVVADGRLVPDVRDSRTGWIQPQYDWLAEELVKAARSLNGQYYGFDLWGLAEPFQFTIYEPGQFYTWHLDVGDQGSSLRKLSMVLHLDDPKDYDGGQLQVQVGDTPMDCRSDRGLLVAFPSWTLHRVTPVTRGRRRTLVVWVSGPAWR